MLNELAENRVSAFAGVGIGLPLPLARSMAMEEADPVKDATYFWIMQMLARFDNGPLRRGFSGDDWMEMANKIQQLKPGDDDFALNDPDYLRYLHDSALAEYVMEARDEVPLSTVGTRTTLMPRMFGKKPERHVTAKEKAKNVMRIELGNRPDFIEDIYKLLSGDRRRMEQVLGKIDFELETGKKLAGLESNG